VLTRDADLSFDINLPIFAIVPAGGMGSRLGSSIPKQYLPLLQRDGQSVSLIEETVSVLLGCQSITKVLVVIAPDDVHASKMLAHLANKHQPRLELLFKGGQTRRDTVLAGCDFLKQGSSIDKASWVLVHDAARPGATSAQVEAMIEQLKTHAVGGLLALPVADTVKLSDGLDPPSVSSTQDRSLLWLAQTPQMFRLGLLHQALSNAVAVTDEAGAVEAQGLSPMLIRGSATNFKVTTNEDLSLMRLLKANPRE
jgi:2-C-methyl-D-erythritol 4-phosphate cytidylyltransferase